MKLFKKVSLTAVTLLVLFSISCEDHPKINPAVDPRTQYFANYLESEAFASLKLKPEQLDMAHTTFLHEKNNDYHIMIIPVNDTGNISYVYAYYKLQGSTTEFLINCRMSFNTDIDYSQLGNALVEKRFDGSIDFDFPSEIHTLTMVRGKVTKKQAVAKKAANAVVVKGPPCGLVQAGECAARSIDNMAPLAYALCVVDIVQCFGVTVIDCIIKQCPWTVLVTDLEQEVTIQIQDESAIQLMMDTIAPKHADVLVPTGNMPMTAKPRLPQPKLKN